VKFRNLLILIPDMSAADAPDRYIRERRTSHGRCGEGNPSALKKQWSMQRNPDLEIQQKSILTGRSDPVKKRVDGILSFSLVKLPGSHEQHRVRLLGDLLPWSWECFV
jgi:hypothetical protein